MPFKAHDLRYDLPDSFPKLYAYLHSRARLALGTFGYDADEVELVIEHVIEQLTKVGLLGGGDHTPETALDHLSDAQFHAFLNRSITNKAIDRLRKRRLPTSSLSAFEDAGNIEEENDPLNTISESMWGTPPFLTPETAALQAASQRDLRRLIIRCIEALSSAPRQLFAIIQELEDLGMDDVAQRLRDEFALQLAHVELSHLSQHKDHAHKKLRQCLQHNSTNLAVLIALRITEYRQISGSTGDMSIDVKALTYEHLSEEDVRTGLHHLARIGLLSWHGEEVVHITSDQRKHLMHFYEEEE